MTTTDPAKLAGRVRALPRLERADASKELGALRAMILARDELRRDPRIAAAAGDAALATSDGAQRAALLGLLMQLARALEGPLDEDQRSVFLRITKREGWAMTPEQRVLFLHFAGPRRWEELSAMLSEPDVELGLIGTWFDKLYTHEPFDEAWDAIEGVLSHGSWILRRVVLNHLGPAHEAAIPALGRMAAERTDDPVLCRDIARALGTIGHISAEPALLVLARHPVSSVSEDAVAALADLGTRASIRTLAEVKGAHPERAALVDDALARILERYPAKAEAGSLSLAEHDDIAGALSLAGASPGDVSLYEVARRGLSESMASSQDEVGSQLPVRGLYLLPPAPRALPMAVRLDLIAGGRSGDMIVMYLIFFVSMLVTLIFPMHHLLAVIWFLGAVPFVLIKSFGETRAPLRALREGAPVYAQLWRKTSEEYEHKGATRHDHLYTFTFLDALGTQQMHEERHRDEQAHLEDDALEPALHVGDDLVLLDSISGVTITDDGRLTVRSPMRTVGLSAAYVSLFIAPTLYFLSVLVS